jgi:hypothetical protein
MRICLNMIVKDEAANLPRLFASVADAADCFVISDTGSRDGTPELLERLSRDHGIPGLVTRHPWIDFAANRNLALKHAMEARDRGEMDFEWVMVMDADEELRVNDPHWRAKLSPGESLLAYKRAANISYQHDLLLWVEGQAWQWEGRIHSHIRNRNRGHAFKHTNDLAVLYHEFEGAKSKPFSNGRQKAMADIDALSMELEGKSPEAGNIHRFFQIGHAYRNTGSYSDCVAVMHAVANAPFAGPQLAYAALVMAGHCLMENGQAERAKDEYARAMRIDPLRWEAPYHLALAWRATGEPARARDLLEERMQTGYEDMGLFWKEHGVYEWRLPYELCYLRSLTGASSKAVDLASSLLAAGSLPAMESAFLRKLLERMVEGTKGIPPLTSDPQKHTEP